MSAGRGLAGDDQGAFALALLSLPGAGPVNLAAALDGRTPAEAWSAVCAGSIERPRPRIRRRAGGEQLPFSQRDVAGFSRGGAAGSRAAEAHTLTWQAAALRADLEMLWRSARAHGIQVTWRGEGRYPPRLSADPEAPPILTWRGQLECLSGPTAALVGTRHCTPAGRATAQAMGQDLAAEGVCVVSGLALGIDGAAHQGALAAGQGAAPTAGIAASGADVPYPRQHRGLWEEVVQRGVVLSETAPGRPAQAWRFPARNRIIAGLADVVVVVESFEAGGSLLTVDAALARGIEVRAVPGPVQSAASLGTNRLLVDGAGPVRHAGDVLDALRLISPAVGAASSRRAGKAGGAGGAGRVPARAAGAGYGEYGGAAPVAASRLAPADRRVFEAVGWAPTALGRIVERSGCAVGVAMRSLARLEDLGAVIAGPSWWVRRPER